MMSVETSYYPKPLDLPDCWVAMKTIGPIVITYDGPSLVGATVALKFFDMDTPLTLNASRIDDISDVEFPNRWEIEFDAWDPPMPNTEDGVTRYKMQIIYGVAAAPYTNTPLHYGKWKLRELPV